MKRALLLVLVLSLAACGGYSGGGYTFSQTGTQGIELEFIDEFPASEVYEGDPLPSGVVIRNLGVWDVKQDELIVSWSFDPLYISRGDSVPDPFGFNPFGFAGGIPSADGFEYPLTADIPARSEYYPEGGEDYYEELGFVTNQIIGQREAPETDLFALACYQYGTRLVEGVCIDVDSFMRTGREQVCKGQDLTFSSQGAPVAFTNVEVRTVPVASASGGSFRYARPEFLITLRNVGGGTVIAPPQDDLQKACQLDVPQEELGSVAVRGALFDRALSCKPYIVRLRDGEGRTRCTFADSGVTGDNPNAIQLFQNANRNQNPFELTANIMTVLDLQALYVYRDSISHTLTIRRSLFEESEAFNGDSSLRYKGYVYEGSGRDAKIKMVDGRPVTLCDEYRGNPETAPEQLPPITDAYSCACSTRECSTEMMQLGYCVPSLCPGSYECCNKADYDSFKRAVALDEDEREDDGQ